MLSYLIARSAFAVVVLMTVGLVALGAPLPGAVAAIPNTPVLQQGAGLHGSPRASVREVQRTLARRGFGLGRPGVDGRFGPLTAAAVRRMQSRFGLVPDGIVGPKTGSVLHLMREATRSRRSQPERRPSHTTAQPSQGSSQTTPHAAKPGRRTAGQVARRSSNAGLATIPTVVAAIAALLAAMALGVAFARGRGSRIAPALAPIDRDLFLEGHSDRPGIGAFRGFAIAATAPARGGRAHGVRYLVDDTRKPAPVWVESDEVRRSPSQAAPGEPMIGYVASGPDPLAEQEAFMNIETACEQAGWALEDIVRDRDTGRMVGRPGLTNALERIAAGEARGLVVSDASTVVRSLADLGALLEWFREAEATLVALDIELDTATTHGHQTASTLISVSGWEAERTATRARRGLAHVQTRSRTPVPTAEERAILLERIRAMHAAGMSTQAIAAQLRNEGVPPLPGAGRWGPTVVQGALDTPSRARSIRDELPSIPGRRQQ